MKYITVSGLFVLCCTMAVCQEHNISRTEDCRLSVVEGTVPQLPYHLWTDYADGYGEYRQVKWMNASLDTEQNLADPSQHPAGSHYEVRGFIVGDNTTVNGFPVTAYVDVMATVATSQAFPKPIARPLPLGKVHLTGQNRLTHNRDLDIDHLLSLNPFQQLYNYYDTYGTTVGTVSDGVGFPSTTVPVSDGWDSPTTKLKGHGTGHYLSALALAYASCPDREKKEQLFGRIRLMVDEMRRCQERTFVWSDSLGRYFEARDVAPEPVLRQLKGTWDAFDRYKQDYRHYGYGYLNAIPPQHCVLIEMYRAYNNEECVWAPYYTVHKQLAGLIDIVWLVDDRQVADKALLIARDMGLWVWNRLHYRTFVQKEGSQAERRSRPGNRYEMWNMYIAGEVGGMAESLASLSMMVSDREQSARLLEAASYFDSPAFFDPLARGIDAIRGRHANQHIPMITGALKCYEAGASPYYYQVASNFWQMVQGRYRYAMGGVGNGEMFRQPYTQMLAMATNPEPTLNETCCAYNLAKLTKDLNAFTPGDARLMDYYERLLYNQLVGSLRPDEYQVVYQYAVGLDASKPWGNETPQSTCCGGTGMENHLRYQEAAYFVNDTALWVSLYLPTKAVWEAKGIVLCQDCQWPAEHTTLRLEKGKGRFALKLRVPYWATEGFDVRLNGRSVASHYQPCSYVEIPMQQWTTKDVVEVIMPFPQHLDYAPDKMEADRSRSYTPAWTAALMRGPLVMAATGVSTWEEATVGSVRDLERFRFVPDYEANEHVTHYFRFLSETTVPSVVDTLLFRQTLQTAQRRLEAQQAWQAMEVKVPEHAPWAPYGFARMQSQYDEARLVLSSTVSPAEAERRLVQLNVALSTMRPGNLAELEDMIELQALMEKVSALNVDSVCTERLQRSRRVVRYVTDGSGTIDMIARSVAELRALLEERTLKRE